MQIFDHTKRPQRTRLLDNQKPGHVKAKLALFDSNVSSYSKKGTAPQHTNLAQPAVKSIDIRADKKPYDHHMISKKTKDKYLKTIGNNSSSSTETLNAWIRNITRLIKVRLHVKIKIGLLESP